MRNVLIFACLFAVSIWGIQAQVSGPKDQAGTKAASDSKPVPKIGPGGKADAEKGAAGESSVDGGANTGAAGDAAAPGAKGAEGAAPDAGAAPAAKEPDPGGDVIKLKSGAELHGLQVINETPTMYVVEIFEGVPPLEIPRRQVLEIKYDNIDPSRGIRPGGATPAAQTEGELPGKNVDPMLFEPGIREKLTADISNPAPVLKGLSLPDALKALSDRAGFRILPSPGLTALPKEQLTWKLEVQPGANLVSLLNDDVPTQFPNVVVRYLEDGIHVFASKEEAEAFEQSSKGSPAAPPAGTPPGAPIAPPAGPPSDAPSTAPPPAEAPAPAAPRTPGALPAPSAPPTAAPSAAGTPPPALAPSGNQ